MDCVVDRDNPGAVSGLAAELQQYLRRHGERSAADLEHETTRTLQTLLERVCRCEGSLARVNLEWRSDQPSLTVMGAPSRRDRRPLHTPLCELSAEAALPARRCEERSFVFSPANPKALPAPEEFGADGWVTREPFLKALVIEATSRVERDFGPDAVDGVISDVGGDVGNRMEDNYRRARGIVERLTPAQMGELFVGLKKAIGGDFYVLEANDQEIVLGNRRCPFGEAVRNSPSLCRMTSSVFGGIAARNVGFSAVCLDERIAIGDPECRVRVLLRPEGTVPSGAHRYGTPTRSLRLAIVVTSALVRASMGEYLSQHGVEVVSSHDDPETALQALPEDRVDVLVIDLPERDTAKALDVALAARDRQPGLAVVVLCEDPDPLTARRLIAAGPGVGHLLKDDLTGMSSYLASLRAVAEGETVISPAITKSLAAAQDSELADLTRRELEVLALVADGYSNPAIADQLTISKRAVEKHLGNVFRKLHLADKGSDRRVQASLLYHQTN